MQRQRRLVRGASSSRLTVFFTYFYVAITFNADEVADNMKKYGGFIPGIRAGAADRGVPRLRADATDGGRVGLPRDASR